MDQIRIGEFIKAMRKEKNLTQQELADKLRVDGKTVSKWECGRGLPEVSLMMPLCEELGISVNELLSGRRIEDEDYRHIAEVNLMEMLKEKKENRKKIVLQFLTFLIVFAGSITLILLGGLLPMETGIRIALIALATLMIVLGVSVIVVIDMETGYYECPHCKHRFIPSAKEYIFGVHTITKRRLRCPKCGKVSFCKQRLTKK